jgi:hypothetical protein
LSTSTGRREPGVCCVVVSGERPCSELATHFQKIMLEVPRGAAARFSAARWRGKEGAGLKWIKEI